jgi:quinol monooxygenase YgiN
MTEELTIRPTVTEMEGATVGQVSLLTKVTAKEGKADELLAAVRPLFDQVRNEPGTLLYVMNRAKDDPNVFWFSELYADDDAFAAHGASDAMAKVGPTLGPLIAGTEFIVSEPVLAKDLPGLAF